MADSGTWEEVCYQLGRNELPWALDMAVASRRLTDLDEIAKGVEDAWVGAEFPMDWLRRVDWLDLFNRVGYLENEKRSTRPTEPVTLYRAAPRGLRFRWSWTDDLDQARWFSTRLNAAQRGTRIWAATIPPEKILAHFPDGRGEHEWVVIPTGTRVIQLSPENVDEILSAA